MSSVTLRRHAPALLLAVVGLHGCHWGDRHTKAAELAELPGLSMLEFDGVFVQLERGSSDATGPYLVVAGQAVEQAALRPGESFVLTDGRGVHEIYHVVLVGAESITLTRRRTFDRRATGEGFRTVDDVVTVTPYDRDQTD